MVDHGFKESLTAVYFGSVGSSLIGQFGSAVPANYITQTYEKVKSKGIQSSRTFENHRFQSDTGTYRNYSVITTGMFKGFRLEFKKTSFSYST